MAWIRTIDPGEAQGLLRRLYEAAVRRAGKVYNVVRVQSLRPRMLQASTRLYTEVVRSAECGLSREQREMIATVVSSVNRCRY